MRVRVTRLHPAESLPGGQRFRKPSSLLERVGEQGLRERVIGIESSRLLERLDRFAELAEPSQARTQKEVDLERRRHGQSCLAKRGNRLLVPGAQMQRHSEVRLQRRLVRKALGQFEIKVRCIGKPLLRHGFTRTLSRRRGI